MHICSVISPRIIEEILQYVTTLMDLEKIMQSEISQSQKGMSIYNAGYMHLLITYIYIQKELTFN